MAVLIVELFHPVDIEIQQTVGAAIAFGIGLSPADLAYKGAPVDDWYKWVAVSQCFELGDAVVIGFYLFPQRIYFRQEMPDCFAGFFRYGLVGEIKCIGVCVASYAVLVFG